MNEDKLRKLFADFQSHIDSDYQYDFASHYSKIGDNPVFYGKHAGSDGEHTGADYIVNELEKMGMPEIQKIAMPTMRFQFTSAELSVLSGNNKGTIIKPHAYISPGTPPSGITAALCDVGKASKDEIPQVDITGKMAIVEGIGTTDGISLTIQAKQAEEAGAAAILIYAPEDIISDDAIRMQYLNRTFDVPVVGISIADAQILKDALSNDPDTEVCLKVDSELMSSGGTSYEIVGRIPGLTSEQIVFSAHYDHFFSGVEDNVASVAGLLGIARAMIDMGYKPNRTMTFVFNGNHELGMVDARYSYIMGSYNIAHKFKNEGILSIADINFEENALPLAEFNTVGSYEYNDLYGEFMKYMPPSLPGLDAIRHEINYEGYYFMTWCDTISMIDSGVPAFQNDAITGGYGDPNHIYSGREHSNYDNMDVFRKDAIASTTYLYGALGLFFDQHVLAPMNYGGRIKSLMLLEDDHSIMNSLGIDFKEFEKQLDILEKKSNKLYNSILTLNDNNVADFTQAEPFNRKLLQIFKSLSDTFDKMGPHDFVMPGHRKYLDNIFNFEQAKNLLTAGKVQDALDKICAVDLAEMSLMFEEKHLNILVGQINGAEYGPKRHWAKGRELTCLICYELINSIAQKKDITSAGYEEELKAIDEYICSEADALKRIMEYETHNLILANDEITSFTQQIEEK